MAWLVNTMMTVFSCRWQMVTADKVKGIYVRPYPTTSQPDMVRQVGSGKNFPGDAMKRGYVTVNLGSDFDAK
ncbi:putative Cation transport ATPase [Shigella dysenteriae]|nr:putative Cation transport ATPase [Shigella dysenteriae]